MDELYETNEGTSNTVLDTKPISFIFEQEIDLQTDTEASQTLIGLISDADVLIEELYYLHNFVKRIASESEILNE
ncbi:MAG: hypothetical protein GTO18_13500 [Anaerolineales bacterium]|nr:hypothetical protein [Anaerolineales bacterium]